MRAWEGETIARAIEQKSAPFSGLALDILAHLHLVDVRRGRHTLPHPRDHLA
jgi:hypothetical protein